MEFKIKGKVLEKCNSNNKEIIIPEGITRIGNYAFSECDKITSITLPNTIKSIGKGAFTDCKNLKQINLPNCIKSIGIEAFLGCESLSSITIPNNIKRINKSTFQDCTSLTDITIPGNVECICWGAFQFCTGLKTVTMLEGIQRICNSSFSCCDIDTISIPASVKTIGSSAFIGSTIKELHVNDLSAFFAIDYKHKLLIKNRRYEKLFVNGEEFKIEPELIIPSNTTTIGRHAFFSNRKITSVYLPESVVSVGEGAFLNCEKLKSFSFSSNLKTIENIELSGSPIEKLATVQVLVEKYIKYFYFGSESKVPIYPKCELNDVTITPEQKKKYLPALLEKCKKDPKYYIAYAAFADEDTVKELIDKLSNMRKKDNKTILRIKGGLLLNDSYSR